MEHPAEAGFPTAIGSPAKGAFALAGTQAGGSLIGVALTIRLRTKSQLILAAMAAEGLNDCVANEAKRSTMALVPSVNTTDLVNLRR